MFYLWGSHLGYENISKEMDTIVESAFNLFVLFFLGMWHRLCKIVDLVVLVIEPGTHSSIPQIEFIQKKRKLIFAIFWYTYDGLKKI